MAACGVSSQIDKFGNELKNGFLKKIEEEKRPFAVSEVANFPWNHICILWPYQDRLPKEGKFSNEFSGAINAELDRLSFKADEGHWAMAFVDTHTVKIARLARGDDLDVMSPPTAKDVMPDDILHRIEPLSCASRGEAFFVPFAFQSRNYFVLGRMNP